MATRKASTKSTAGRAPARNAGAKGGTRKRAGARTRLTPAAAQRGLSSAEIALPFEHAEVAPLVALIRDAGGAPIGAYRDPLGSRPLVIATLPLAAVQPTPFQRDLSPTHTKRLAAKIDEARAFLDPLVVVQGHDGRFWTPNGRHRLAAAKVLGLRQITAMISPDESLAYRILALNTEKAHNLKDRSLEVIRMARTLAKREPGAKERAYADQFESPEFLTLGIVYESPPRFAGGAYGSFLKKVDRFSERTLAARCASAKATRTACARSTRRCSGSWRRCRRRASSRRTCATTWSRGSIPCASCSRRRATRSRRWRSARRSRG